MNASPSAMVTRRSGTSFYAAFVMLPPAKRRALEALYAFCRIVDDCVDDARGAGAPGLDRWSAEVDAAFAGRDPRTEIGRAIAAALERFPMPRASFRDVIEGCRMDLAPRAYQTFDDLRVYCERVASAVGLAAIEIFGYRDPQTKEYARELGVALQLINIVRDLGGDALAGRVYVPGDDLDAQLLTRETFRAAASGSAPRTPAVDRVVAAQAERALSQYRHAQSLLPAADRRSMLPAQVMAATYREILARLAARGYPFGERLRLNRLAKARVALRTVASEMFA